MEKNKKGNMKVKKGILAVDGKKHTILHLTDGLEEMVDTLLDNNKSYILYGKPGTGKTYSIKQIKKSLDRNALYINSAPELASLTSRSGIEAAKAKVLNSIEYAGYIIIDDLGSERTNSNHYGDESPVMEEIICETIYRKWEEYKESGKPLKVYLTSNLNQKGLIEKYGERTMSRLVQMCTFVFVDCEDLRVSDELDWLNEINNNKQ